jgi:hypothetical protein
VKWATVLLTSAIIKSRGNDALTMSNALQPGAASSMDPTTSADMRICREILASYRRIR